MRLTRGDFAQETAYGADPLPMAREHAQAGARRLHVVDLDASAGTGDNRDMVERLVAESGLKVQVAGGVRNAGDVDAWLAIGAAAVVMGTAAVRDPALLDACGAAHPGQVFAALDVREGRAAVRGWSATEEKALEQLLAGWAVAPLAGIILTSVDRDGTLAGPDLELLSRVRRATSHELTYSGGISSIADLRRLAEAGAAAAILGKALFEGRFSLGEALAAC